MILYGLSSKSSQIALPYEAVEAPVRHYLYYLVPFTIIVDKSREIAF